MYPNFIPGGPMMFNSVPYAMGGMARAGAVARGTGMLSKLGLAGKSINWGGLLNNASKTLGVVNQAIPLVKQAGPMFNNQYSQNNTSKYDNLVDEYQYNKPNFFI